MTTTAAMETNDLVLSPEKIPTNLTTRNHAVHRWFNFTAGFSPEFVQSVLSDEKVSPGSKLLDPFCGAGTALVQANAAGVDAVGYEVQPFLRDMARAKCQIRSLDSLRSVRAILEGVVPTSDFESIWGDSAIKFLTKLVDHENLMWLAGARIAERRCGNDDQVLYRLVVSRVLEFASGSATDGIYKAPTTRKRSINCRSSVEKIADLIYEDLCSDEVVWGSTTIYPKSSEKMCELESDSLDVCVTSPPYLNNFDFAEMTRMEIYYWSYADSWGDITRKVRSQMIVNTTTAPKELRRADDKWRIQLGSGIVEDLDSIRDELMARRREKGGQKEYETLVLPYFAQMREVLKETYRVLKTGGSIHLIVSDAALYGVHIRTELFLSRLMCEVGFHIREIRRLRDRGGRWVLEKREGAKVPLGEFLLIAEKRS